jgi:hypothetical protein
MEQVRFAMLAAEVLMAQLDLAKGRIAFRDGLDTHPRNNVLVVS